MAAKKLVQVSEKAFTKAKRSAFKNLIKSLRQAGEETAIGSYSGGFGNYRWNPGVAVIGELATRSKYGTERLAPLEDVLSQRMADPTEIALEAIRTGRLDGKKLSSQQRRQVFATLDAVNQERDAVETLDHGAFIGKPSIPIIARGGYNYNRDKSTPAGRKAEEILGSTYSSGSMKQFANMSPAIRKNPPQTAEEMQQVMNQVIASAQNLPPAIRDRVVRDARNAIVLKNLAEQSGRGWEGVPAITAPNVTRGQAERLRTMRETTGVEPYNYGYRDFSGYDAFMKLRDAMELTADNPRAQEMVRSMYKEWTGTAEELATAARLLSD